MSSCQNTAKAQGLPLRKSNPALSSTKTPMQKGSWHTPTENLGHYYLLNRTWKENPQHVNHWYLKMTFLLSLWLGMLSLPCSVPGKTPNSPAPTQGGSIKAKEKGRWTDQTILLPHDLWVQTHHNTLCNLKHMLRWRQKSMITASGVYADQCLITALVAISESVMKRKDVLGLLSILIIPVWE